MGSVLVDNKLVIATRASRLALWQAYHVKDKLEKLYPDLQVELLEMTTKGDQILDKTLSKIGGKGLFIKELETALLDGRADIAVHSLKDVPVDLSLPFTLSAIMARSNPYDALVSNKYDSLVDMPAGSIVGTSSLRRESQLRAKYPNLTIRPLRGNLDTRLAKLDRGEYDAIVLAAAGLERLGLADRIKYVLPIELSLPPAGQGTLGIETLAERTDLKDLLAPLVDAKSSACAIAERAVSRVLGGSCQVPLAAHAVIEDQHIFLRALVALPDGSKILHAQGISDFDQADDLGKTVAQDLLSQGAREILDKLAV